MIVCTPIPATVGLKTPVALTPGPLHVPPAVAVVNVKGASLAQTPCGMQIEASQHVEASGTQAVAAITATPPDRVASVEVPVPPHAIISPPELTSTSKTLNAVG